MKKIVAGLATLAVLASTVSADFVRVEMGAGAWEQTPKGFIHIKDNSMLLNLDGTYTSNETMATNAYVWAFIKHPIPIIPNLRLEYAKIIDEGKTEGTVAGVDIPGSAPTTFDITQYDIVPYYNILDNTFWITVDLGLDIKIMQTDVTIGAINSDPVIVNGITTIPATTIYEGYKDSKTTPIPLLYVRGRVQVPTTNIGFESEIKAITDGTNTMYDMSVKLDYTLGFIPVVQPALEVGYRVQQLTVDDGDNQVDLNYAGVYAGLMVRF